MKIEDIDKAKQLKDEIYKLNKILESSQISSITIEYYGKGGTLGSYTFRNDDYIINALKNQIKNKEDILIEKLSELL